MNFYDIADQEPPLDELMDDPIVQLLMKGDGVTSAFLLPIIEQARNQTGAAILAA